MYCPFCSSKETKVVDSRLVAGGSQIKRRRECTKCGERFSTYEEAELVMPIPMKIILLIKNILKNLERKIFLIEEIEKMMK